MATQLRPFLTDIANAIRTKKGTSGVINAQNFASEIASIPSGGDIQELNAVPTEVDANSPSKIIVNNELYLKEEVGDVVRLDFTNFKKPFDVPPVYQIVFREYELANSDIQFFDENNTLFNGQILDSNYKGLVITVRGSTYSTKAEQSFYFNLFKPDQNKVSEFFVANSEWSLDGKEFYGSNIYISGNGSFKVKYMVINKPIDLSVLEHFGVEIYYDHYTYMYVKSKNNSLNLLLENSYIDSNNRGESCDYLFFKQGWNIDIMNKILNELDYSRCKSSKYMFSEAHIQTNPNVDLSNFITLDNTFANCQQLKSTTTLNTNSATSMSAMFSNCPRLEKIDITKLVSSTSRFAFWCYRLKTVIIRTMNTIPTFGSNMFGDCHHFTGTQHNTYNPDGLKDGRIYVPDDKVEELKAATGWSDFADIIVPLSTLQE